MATITTACIDLTAREVPAIPAEMPLVILLDGVIFPSLVVPLAAQREKAILALRRGAERNGFVFLAAQKEATDNPTPDQIHHIGTIATVVRMCGGSEGRLDVVVRGVAKGRIVSFASQDPLYAVVVEQIAEMPHGDHTRREALRMALKREVEALGAEGRPAALRFFEALDWDNPSAPGMLAGSMLLKSDDGQRLLELDDPVEQMRLLLTFVLRERELLRVEREVKASVMARVEKETRVSYLQEQLRAIRRELTKVGGEDYEDEELRRILRSETLTEAASREGMKQLSRLTALSPWQRPDALREWFAWLAEIPWKEQAPPPCDLLPAKQVLKENHLYLKDVKERLLDHLATLGHEGETLPVLCLAGPPGVGKSTLARSLARALQRPLVPVNVGAMSNEAELRGVPGIHPGALPGMVMRGIADAGTGYVVLLLDELDRIPPNSPGILAALTEIFDPERRRLFSDRYLNIPFDLSRAVIVAALQEPDRVPRQLRERMEVIALTGYCDEEKIEIAKHTIIPRQVQRYGLSESLTGFRKNALSLLINGYTWEAGVTGLERAIGTICRKVARKRLETGQSPSVITPAEVDRCLGRPYFSGESRLDRSEIGVATGLAWTAAGGEIVFVEATVMEGRGGVVLTGSLGEVMRESAETAISFIRSHAAWFGLSSEIFATTLVHVHVPGGAMPKDGPSAGVAIATAVLSAFLAVPVKRTIAMTGEITLRGRVLPVGGVREKLLGAVRSEVDTLVLPEKNMEDIADIPRRVANRIRLVPVKTVNEVFSHALEQLPTAE